MTAHSDRARRALAHLPEADPALAALALWCAHRDAEWPGLARSEGDTILYGAGFPTLPLQEQIGLAGHHILHVALRHPARMAAMAARLGDAFDPWLYALAADALVNGALEVAGHALPRPAVSLPDLLARAGLPVAEPEACLSAWDADRLYLVLVQAGAEARARLTAYGAEHDFEVDLAPAPGASEEDARAPDWQGHLTRALEAGRNAGRGLGMHAAALGELALPRVAWERRLRGAVSQAVGDGPRISFRRPSGAWIAMESVARQAGGPVPVFQPGRSRDARRPRIAVGLDTSGSIDDAILARLGAELDGIARRSGAEVHLLAFDDTVHHAECLPPGGVGAALAARTLRRGGGTSFVDVLSRATEIRAAVAIILTDLDGPTGPPPRFPVLWAVPKPAPPPPFGTVITLDA